MNEEIKKLFTPVSEGLPEKNKTVLVILNGYLNLAQFNGHYWDCGVEGIKLYNDKGERTLTHWLDLQKLSQMLFNPEIHTTKELAIDLARDAYIEGSEKNGGLNDAIDFITQNKHIL